MELIAGKLAYSRTAISNAHKAQDIANMVLTQQGIIQEGIARLGQLLGLFAPKIRGVDRLPEWKAYQDILSENKNG